MVLLVGCRRLTPWLPLAAVAAVTLVTFSLVGRAQAMHRVPLKAPPPSVQEAVEVAADAALRSPSPDAADELVGPSAEEVLARRLRASGPGSKILHRHFVANAASRNALCNDASPAAFYTSLVPGAKRWLLFLEGGAGCYNLESCQDRSNNHLWLASSKPLPATRDLGEDVQGSLQRDCTLNPGLCDASIVWVHYCSSDWWTGTETSGPGDFKFLGKFIVKAVAEDVAQLHEFRVNARELLLAGTSAGGVGVWQNADVLASIFAEKAPSVSFSAFADSAWFLGGPSIQEWPCNETFFCNQEEHFVLGSKMWKAQLQEDCVASVPAELSWKCLFSYNVHRHVKTRLFTAHFLSDLWQAREDGVLVSGASALTSEQSLWVLSRSLQSHALTRQLGRHRGVFATACLEHGAAGMGNDAFWLRRINGTTMAEALAAWLDGDAVRLLDSPAPVHGNPTCNARS